MRNEILLSLVVPAYNEEGRIEGSIRRIIAFLGDQPYMSEVIVVDDGSTDNTARLVRRHIEGKIADVQIRLIRHQRNMGKGCAVKNGVLQARGEIVLFTDVDLSAPIEQAPKLLEPILANECDIAIGSRALKGSVIRVRQPRWREASGKIFNFFVRLISGLNLRDTQCGFKAFRRKLAESVFRLQTINGFGFDVEVLYIARKRGLRVLEIPVIWSDSRGTKVRFHVDAPRMLLDLIKIRANDLLGKYELASDSSSD